MPGLAVESTDVRPNVVALAVLFVSVVIGLLLTWAMGGNPVPTIAAVIIGIVLMQSPRVAQQWERAVVLRLGRFIGLHGPGVFWMIPFVDTVTSWIDQRTITTSFAAEQTLTSDTVPVNVDAVLFWMVHDAQKAALEVQDYAHAVSWAAQTALRDIIGRTALTELLRGRERIETELQQLIDQRSNPWGVTVHSVEMRDVVIPSALQDAMSREAQAAREKAGAHHPRRSRARDRAFLFGSGQVLPEQPDRAAPPRDEHAVRRIEREGRADADSEQCGRVDGHGRTDGRRRAAATGADDQQNTRVTRSNEQSDERRATSNERRPPWRQHSPKNAKRCGSGESSQFLDRPGRDRLAAGNGRVRLARGTSLFGVLVAASAPTPAAALHPVPAIDAIVEALRTHDVVGADTGHGGPNRNMRFSSHSIRDPRVAEHRRRSRI